MRRLDSTVLLSLLVACTVTTTGAPCSSDLNCPSDQGCGNDGRCGAAALACPGHTIAGQCIPGTSCLGGELATCTATGGVCSTGPVTTPCPAHQQCTSSASAASCACVPTRCNATTSSFCSTGGQVVTCAQDAPPATGCWYEASSTACGDPGKACVENGSSGSAACVCPTVNACTTLGATQCGATGQQVLRCGPVVAGSTCLTWQAETNCASSSLSCRAGACVCPDNPGPLYVADAVNGSPAGAPPIPTGLDSPAACRYRTLADALASANLRGSGATVRARGWSASVPGGVVVFSEAGALSIGAGVAVTTDDAVPAIGHYAITTAAALTGAFVTVGPGSSVSGFEIRNEASTGAGIATSCPNPADVGPVTFATMRIAAASGGTPIVRLASGVHLTGYCPASLSGVTVAGAVTGILAEAEAGAPTTMTGGAVTGNGTGVAIGAAGAAAPAFSATGTAFRSNTGDGVYVARGALFSDACPYVDNGTHVHAQPVGGATVSVTVQNSSGAAKMTGATNSAFRLLAMGSGSAVSLLNNTITGNDATQSYNVVSGLRRGGGVVLTAPFPGTASFRGNGFYGNKWDQVLVAASAPDTLDVGGDPLCGLTSNIFACYDPSNPSVGMYSNGASVNAAWNHWTRQPGVFSVDVAGSGVTGYDTLACPAATVTCP